MLIYNELVRHKCQQPLIQKGIAELDKQEKQRLLNLKKTQNQDDKNKKANNESDAKLAAHAAVTLMRMKHFDKVWPLLKHKEDPRVRSYLIHRMSKLKVDPEILIEQYKVERMTLSSELYCCALVSLVTPS